MKYVKYDPETNMLLAGPKPYDEWDEEIIKDLHRKTKNKKDIYKRLKNGEIDVLIGTHALISTDVEYNNLGLVITDEQHRFGVNQRSNLRNKGKKADVS